MNRSEKQIFLILIILIVFTASIFVSTFKKEIQIEPTIPTTEEIVLEEFMIIIDEKITSLQELNALLDSRAIKINTVSRGQQYQEMQVEATAYCSCAICCGKTDGITFLGFDADKGAIAVDPAVIPLGSVLWVQGYGYGVAIDTGGSIKGDRVDLWFPSHQEALDWGRKEVRIRVY